MDKESLINKLKRKLQALPDISAVYLFGSMAKGNTKAGSDIDIAVLFTDKNTGKTERFERRLELEIELEKLVGTPVDLIDLELAQPALQHQVRKHGKLILEKDHRYRVNFEVASRRRYFDLTRMRKLRNTALLKKLGD